MSFKLNILTESNSNPSHLNLDYLQKYGNGEIFIETGTYLGDTVKLALSSGYKKIHSIELDLDLFQKAQEMFKNDDRVTIWYGDSVDCLDNIMKDITSPATFWLDAHASEIGRAHV